LRVPDYIEYELGVISKTGADFIVIDGFGGGTAGAPPTLEDNLGLPLLYCLPRADSVALSTITCATASLSLLPAG